MGDARLYEPRPAAGEADLELAGAAAAGAHADALRTHLATVEREAHLHGLSGHIRRDHAAHGDPSSDERERGAAADLLERELDLPGDWAGA